MGLRLTLLLNTHVHADHITGTGKLKGMLPGTKSVLSEASGGRADVKIREGDKVRFGSRSAPSLFCSLKGWCRKLAGYSIGVVFLLSMGCRDLETKQTAFFYSCHVCGVRPLTTKCNELDRVQENGGGARHLGSLLRCHEVPSVFRPLHPEPALNSWCFLRLPVVESHSISLLMLN